jgi:sugar/nucleoside kinase (ribokinase family)
MTNQTHTKRKPGRPRVWGIGLTALDVILEQGSPQSRVAAGGTCGNVMSILAYFGWHATALARLAHDAAGTAIISDLRRWGVDTNAIDLRPQAKTPIIVEKIRKDSSGVPFHTFSFHCPSCGGRLPQFQPVVSAAVEPFLENNKHVDVVFADRVSRSALQLAESASKKEAVIFFEPSASSVPKQREEMLQLAHIVKCSHDRVEDMGDLEWGPNTVLQIQTMGRGGLQFRTSLDGRHRAAWRTLPAVPVPNLKDAAGAGDWLSAALINCLCLGGAAHLRKRTFEQVVRALSFGQALAAWNCSYSGARGSMYALSSRQFWKVINHLHRGKTAKPMNETSYVPELSEGAHSICGLCQPNGVTANNNFAA